MSKAKSDFIKAKEIVAELEVLQENKPNPASVGNFRKYLTELSKKSDKVFVTKIVEKKLVVIRIK